MKLYEYFYRIYQYQISSKPRKSFWKCNVYLRWPNDASLKQGFVQPCLSEVRLCISLSLSHSPLLHFIVPTLPGPELWAPINIPLSSQSCQLSGHARMHVPAFASITLSQRIGCHLYNIVTSELLLSPNISIREHYYDCQTAPAGIWRSHVTAEWSAVLHNIREIRSWSPGTDISYSAWGLS
jgi:hypothetical protein